MRRAENAVAIRRVVGQLLKLGSIRNVAANDLRIILQICTLGTVTALASLRDTGSASINFSKRLIEHGHIRQKRRHVILNALCVSIRRIPRIQTGRVRHAGPTCNGLSARQIGTAVDRRPFDRRQRPQQILREANGVAPIRRNPDGNASRRRQVLWIGLRW